MSFMGDLCLQLGRPKTARKLLSDAADGLQALGSKQAFHPLLHLTYLTMEDGDLIAVAARCEQLRLFAETSKSPRQQVTLLALELWLSAQREDWPGWDAQVQAMLESYDQFPVFNHQFARTLSEAALRLGRRAQAERALPILELSLAVFQQLGASEDRKRIREAFRPYERFDNR